jgi:hypothetical protein
MYSKKIQTEDFNLKFIAQVDLGEIQSCSKIQLEIYFIFWDAERLIL